MIDLDNSSIGVYKEFFVVAISALGINLVVRLTSIIFYLQVRGVQPLYLNPELTVVHIK